MEISPLEIVTYPHPTLRHRSKPLRRVDTGLREWVRKMFELLYDSEGVGLAANQVNLPFRVFVANLKGNDNDSEEFVFINPVLSNPQGLDEKEEGCLSLPELSGQVKRPERIKVHAYTLEGDEIEGQLDGLFARVVQHETDHLDGVLFADRLSETGKLDAKEALEALEIEFAGRRERGEIPGDQKIAAHVATLEERYC